VRKGERGKGGRRAFFGLFLLRAIIAVLSWKGPRLKKIRGATSCKMAKKGARVLPSRSRIGSMLAYRFTT
jgi:hypothetical protein